jgi:hypothetical protein
MALPVLPAAATVAGQAGVAAASTTAGSTLAAALGPIGLGVALLSAGISYFSQRKAKKKAKKAARAALGELLNFDGTNNFIPVVYGVRRIEGTLVYISTNDAPGGDPNEFLYLVYALCEGEVEQILEADVLIDDLPVTDARFNYTDSINTAIYGGTDGQTADTMLINETADWTADHKLSGIAYIRVRLKWDRKAFNNIPVVSALVYGKKVYDPRTATTAYSTNPALCIRDYLTNTRYGKGLAAGLIDDTAISAAADFYDTTVTFWTGGDTGKVFEFNAIVDTEQSILDNLKDMMLCCRGFLPYTNGIYSLIPDKSASSVFAFTTDNIISGISIRGENKADKYNRMVCTFTDPANNWQENTVIWPEAGSAEEIAYLAEDNGTELIGEIELPYITNFYAARDLARVFLLRSRNAIRTSFNANSDALNVSVGDVVTVTHPTPAWSAKPFQVEEVAINYDGTCTVSLIEYDSSIYSYDPASEQLAYADTDLPNPFAVGAPTSFVATESTILSEDGSVVREITITWTASTDAFVESYELQFKLSAASVYFSVFTEQPRYITTYGDVGEVYDYRIRSINSLGVVSDWLTGTYTTVGDTTAPAIPTGVTISGDYNQVTATWSAATERDYKESWVYQNTSGTTPSTGDTPFRRVTGNSVTVAGLAVSTTYYVWVRNVDFSGNVSGFSSAGTFTTTAGASIADGSVTEPKIASSAVTAGKIATNAVTEDKINALAVTAAKVAAAAIETAKIADGAVATGKIADGAATEAKIATNAITETKITDSAISTPKLAAGAVTAAKITAGTITANEIAASTITGAKIAANTITAGNIAALTITANEIAANAITAGKILAGEITGDKISATFTTTSNLVLTTAGKLYTSGKTSAASTTAGVFLGHDGGSNYDFAVGDGTKSIVWDGSAGTFTITGEVVVLGSLKADSSKTFDGTNFMYELGTATTIAGYSGASILRTQKTTSFALGTIATGSDTFALAGQSTNASGAGYGGAFVNSTTSGGTTHRTEAYLTNSTFAGYFVKTGAGIGAILANATYAGEFTGNVHVIGNITATGTITPFTGSHDGVLDDAIVPALGDILVDVSVIAKANVNDTLTEMDLSSAANQYAIGVYSGDREASYLPMAISEAGAPVQVTPYTTMPGQRVLQSAFATLLDNARIIGCNSVGEGQINVCGEAGDITAGDLIVTSNTAGKGMKQSDDIIRAKTVAKARESVTFADPTEVKMIACIYLCG